MEKIIDWLLEEANPEIRYRTMCELINLEKTDKKVEAARNALLESETFKKIMGRFELGKKWEIYSALCALAEFGLTRNDVEIDKYVDMLIEETNFQMMCGEALLLRNLILLGYIDHPKVNEESLIVFKKQKPDGGYGCLSKNPKINIEKGCYRQTNTYLLLASALKQKDIIPPQLNNLLDYYRNREILYSHFDPDSFAVPDLSGTYYPLDPIKIGLQMTLYSLSILGIGNEKCCDRAWAVLEDKKDEAGRYRLDKSLSKPLYKIGKPGASNKWVTLYVLLSKKYKQVI